MKISFVIPCYGSEHTVASVVDDLRKIIRTLNVDDYEIILVSDASPDNVFSVIRDLCIKDPDHLYGMELAKNFGQHAALMAGYRKTTGDIVFSLDDDGQAPIESVPALINELEKGADVVFGAYDKKKHNIFRNFGSYLNDFMAEKLIGKPKNLQVTSFFAAKKFIIDRITQYDNSFPYLLGLILQATKHFSNVPVKHRERLQGTSGYNFKRLFSLWINGFTAFSVKPLRLATLIGFMCAIFGFLLGFWVIINKIIHPDVPAGYSSIMAVIIFIGGVLMLLLGMIGEYIGRIYICINKSPQYVIRETTRTNL